MAEERQFKSRCFQLSINVSPEVYNALVERYGRDNLVFELENRCYGSIENLYRLIQDNKTILERASAMRSRFKPPDSK